MKQIFKTVNVLEIVRLDTHSSSLSMQEVASNEATKSQTQKKKKGSFFFIQN